MPHRRPDQVGRGRLFSAPMGKSCATSAAPAVAARKNGRPASRPATVTNMGMETLSQAVDRLTAAGYRDDFRAERGGLRALGTDCLHEPESLVIEELVRFEGASDPGDEAILFALHCSVHGTRGTYAVVYGPAIDALDAEMVRRLTDGRPR